MNRLLKLNTQAYNKPTYLEAITEYFTSNNRIERMKEARPANYLSLLRLQFYSEKTDNLTHLILKHISGPF